MVAKGTFSKETEAQIQKTTKMGELLKSSVSGLSILADKIDKQKSDAYWHRRWAGDAMKALISSPVKSALYNEAGEMSAHTDLINKCIGWADLMQKAYKEREEKREGK